MTLSYQNVACTAGFMAVGMQDALKEYPAFEYYGGGVVGLHVELARYAVISEQIVDFISSEGMDFPGVYDYEVSEPFGKWFGERVGNTENSTPSFEVAQAHLIKEACLYFTQSNPGNSSDRAFAAGVLAEKVRAHAKVSGVPPHGTEQDR